MQLRLELYCGLDRAPFILLVASQNYLFGAPAKFEGVARLVCLGRRGCGRANECHPGTALCKKPFSIAHDAHPLGLRKQFAGLEWILAVHYGWHVRRSVIKFLMYPSFLVEVPLDHHFPEMMLMLL